MINFVWGYWSAWFFYCCRSWLHIKGVLGVQYVLMQFCWHFKELPPSKQSSSLLQSSAGCWAKGADSCKTVHSAFSCQTLPLCSTLQRPCVNININLRMKGPWVGLWPALVCRPVGGHNGKLGTAAQPSQIQVCNFSNEKDYPYCSNLFALGIIHSK